MALWPSHPHSLLLSVLAAATLLLAACALCSWSGCRRPISLIHSATMEPAMSVGSSSSAQRLGPLRLAAQIELPLVPCPKCGEGILELTSGAGSKVPGAIFFKCRLHDRDDPRSCPWFLFADKYEKLLIVKGLVEKRGTAGHTLSEIEQIKIAIGRLEGVVEANKTELTPLLANVVSLKNGSDSVAEKLQKLVDLGKIVAVCLVVVAVFVVLGVVAMFFK